MTAREAKKACATEGLVVWAGVPSVYHGSDCCVQAWPRIKGGRLCVTIYAESWSLAVAAFKGWRAEWLKQASR